MTLHLPSSTFDSSNIQRFKHVTVQTLLFSNVKLAIFPNGSISNSAFQTFKLSNIQHLKISTFKANAGDPGPAVDLGPAVDPSGGPRPGGHLWDLRGASWNLFKTGHCFSEQKGRYHGACAQEQAPPRFSRESRGCPDCSSDPTSIHAGGQDDAS